MKWQYKIPDIEGDEAFHWFTYWQGDRWARPSIERVYRNTEDGPVLTNADGIPWLWSVDPIMVDTPSVGEYPRRW